MCKAIDKEMVISDIKLMEKKGGRSGYYKRDRSWVGRGKTSLPEFYHGGKDALI